MATAFKALLLLLLIAAMVWVSTLWRWQTTVADPSGSDVLLYLVILPLVLTASLLAALWLAKKIRALLEPPTPPKAQAKPSDKLSEPKAPQRS